MMHSKEIERVFIDYRRQTASNIANNEITSVCYLYVKWIGLLAKSRCVRCAALKAGMNGAAVLISHKMVWLKPQNKWNLCKWDERKTAIKTRAQTNLKWWYLSPKREHAGIATWTTSKISFVGLFVMCHTYIRTFTHVWHLCAFKSHKVWWRTASHSDIEKLLGQGCTIKFCICSWHAFVSVFELVLFILFFFAPFHWHLIYICNAKPKPKILWNIEITKANAPSLPPLLYHTKTHGDAFSTLKRAQHTHTPNA